MKKIHLFLTLIAFLFSVTSCDNNLVDENVPTEDIPSSEGVLIKNKSGSIDGVTYSLDGIAINPDLVTIGENDAVLISTQLDLSSGVIKLDDVSDEVTASLAAGNILYIKIGDYTGLRKIESVKSFSGSSFELVTNPAQLGELFEEGTLNVSVDLYEAGMANELKTGLRGSVERTYEILDLQDEYDLGGMKYNPATNVKLILNTKMVFKKGQVLPSEFSNIFEIQASINPVLTVEGAINKTYTDDIMNYIPEQMVDFIKAQEFEFDIPINALGIESLPAKLSIKDINIPLEIEANFSKESTLAYGINGSFKIGYEIAISGLKAKTTPVYENSMVVTTPSTTDIHGEVIINSDVIIVPNISFLDDLYTVSGDITFGAKSTTDGHIDVPGQGAIFGSKGDFTSNMDVNVDLLLIKVPVNIFNSEQNIWNIGQINKTVTYSDMTWKVSSKNTTNVLLVSRMYETDFTLNYKYPILGKKVPNELLISYDVYQDNNKTKITSVTDLAINPTDVTANSFKFKLNIPFKTIFISTQSRSYLKNIVIKDRNGYVYEGIYNSSKGIVENSFEIKR